MGEGRFRRVVAFGALLVLGLLVSCTPGFGLTPTPGRQSVTYPIDTVLKEFYQTLGGQPILGPAISALQIRENLQCQFTERVLMCFNPAATDAGRFSLYALGKELKIQEDTLPSAMIIPDGARVINGFTIYDKFLPMYDRLFGARYVGRPLTELRINQDLQRVEQFFENVGFYQALNDPDGPVSLIPYGAYLCSGSCSSHLDEYWSIVKSNTAEQPFATSVARMGGPAVFGSLLLQPQTAADGFLQQAYTNVVFYAPADDPSQVRLRPLPLMLGYKVQQPVERISHSQLVYYDIDGGLGHNVPRPFDEFITAHGGRDLSGNPISEVIRLDGQDVYQQCFENYCLLYEPAAADMLKVRMAPLGKEYIDRNPAPEEVQLDNMFSPERVTLVMSADRPTLNDTDEQYIRILVQQTETGQPMERVEATLMLNFTDRPTITFFFPPTGEDGMSVVVIPPQQNMENGARLSYQVCLNLPTETPVCAMDSYLIWNVQP